MALWHTRIEAISRQVKDGKGKPIPGKQQSVLAAAAYQSGLRLRDERTGEVYDYRRKQSGVLSSTILAPAGAPDWMRDPQALFNAVERKEDESNKHATAQLARAVEFSLPVELSCEQNQALAERWARRLVDLGMVVQISVHEPKPYQGQRNPHVHYLFTMRALLPSGEFGLKVRGWNDTRLYDALLADWQNDVNAALADAGLSIRVDRRSFIERGIDRLPSVHLGKAAALERKGIDTKRGQATRLAAMKNAVRPHLRDVEQCGEVRHYGIGAVWWEHARPALCHHPPAADDPPADPGGASAAATGWRQVVATRQAGNTAPQRRR